MSSSRGSGAGVMAPAMLEQLVGGVAHRRDHGDDVVAPLPRTDDAIGDPCDPLGGRRPRSRRISAPRWACGEGSSGCCRGREGWFWGSRRSGEVRWVLLSEPGQEEDPSLERTRQGSVCQNPDGGDGSEAVGVRVLSVRTVTGATERAAHLSRTARCRRLAVRTAGGGGGSQCSATDRCGASCPPHPASAVHRCAAGSGRRSRRSRSWSSCTPASCTPANRPSSPHHATIGHPPRPPARATSLVETWQFEGGSVGVRLTKAGRGERRPGWTPSDRPST